MSTAKRVFAIIVIFVFAMIAWMILGFTIFQRTDDQDGSLRSKVSSTWGTPHVQSPPSASFQLETQESQVTVEDGKTKTKLITVKTMVFLPLDATRASIALQLEHRQKGLLWYSTYKDVFAGEYTFRNSSEADQDVTFSLPFPAEKAMYDNVIFTLDGTPVEFKNEGNSAWTTRRLGAGKAAVLKVGYSSQGMGNWSYHFSEQI